MQKQNRLRFTHKMSNKLGYSQVLNNKQVEMTLRSDSILSYIKKDYLLRVPFTNNILDKVYSLYNKEEISFSTLLEIKKRFEKKKIKKSKPSQLLKVTAEFSWESGLTTSSSNNDLVFTRS